MTRVYLMDDDNQKIFGEGPYRLLRGVEALGSLRAAAASMGMAYTKALAILTRAENALGCPLTARTTGGKHGGGSSLTAEGRDIMKRYEQYRDQCTAANRALFEQIFSHSKLGCVIMASGLGTRFGGNKLMADFHGKPLIARALAATDGLFDTRVVVTRHPDVAAYCERQQVPVVLHNLPHRNDTVRLGLQALSTELAGCMFCPGDQPLLRKESVAAILNAFRGQPNLCCRLSFGETPGAPVLFPQWAFEELLHLPEGKGGNAVLRTHPDRVQLVQAAFPEELQDVDTAEDLAQLLAFR